MTQLFKIKYLLVILFSISALCSSAQRDINHMQVSLQPGLIYTNNNIGSNISDNFSDLESDFYGASLRIQKRLGSAFQIGIEHGEFRQWNNNNTSFRITALSFGYAWDNGNLLGTRSFISPYHTVIVGSSMMEVSSDINFDNSNFLLGTENGLKFRLGDKWSAELALDLFWISDFESADRIFESDFNYGYQAGISYYFGAVKTNYKAPVFNARRTYTPATSVAAEAPPEKEAAAAPKPEPQPEPKSPPANQQLIDDQNRLIENQNKFIDHLLQLELQKEQSARSAPTDSIDYLYYHRFPKGDVPDTEAREDSLTNISKGELKAARDSLIGTNEPDTVLTRVSPEQGEVVEKISSDTVRVDIADTTKVYRNIDSLSAGVSPDVTTDSMDAFFADTMQTTDS
ncbi:MAG TPA: hypothetical protein VJ911_04040, partial [Cryomorphaceae bacterium]|nr:hypothetical protein [Cryomorphaceae bacterium]